MDRIPAGARFSSPVQNGPKAHQASYTMGTGSFTGVERPGRGVYHPPLLSAEVKKTVELYLYSACVSSLPVLGWALPVPWCVPVLQCGKNCKLRWYQDYSWCSWSPRNSSLWPHAPSYQWIGNSVSRALCINSTLWSPITRPGKWWTFIHIHLQIRPKYLCRSVIDTVARIIIINGRQRTAMCSVVRKYCGCDNSCVVASITVWELDHFRGLMFVVHRTRRANTKSGCNDLDASNYIKKKTACTKKQNGDYISWSFATFWSLTFIPPVSHPEARRSLYIYIYI